jgi:gluconate 5-dehydrogenase
LPFTGFDLTGKRALVCGGGRGLGFEIAKALAEAGGLVTINTKTEQSGRAAVAAIGQGSASAPGDIADPAAIERLFEALGSLDILVNAVGVRDRRPLDAFTLTEIEAHLRTNLVAAFDMSRRAAALMAHRGGGRIIHIASIAGPIARSGDAAYTMAKAGMVGLIHALAAELGPAGITVNGIAPGYFATESNAAMKADPATQDWLTKRASLGRWGKPSEIAGAAVFLASPAASYVTGTVIAVDGGYLSHF